MIQHQIEALASAGVTDVVLAVNYRPEIMAAALETVSCDNHEANGLRRYTTNTAL
jgi:NDP-sugar pyrophosphorylase family protein